MSDADYEARLAAVKAAQAEARKHAARLSAETASRQDAADPDEDELPLMNVLEELARQRRE